jgi:hypothetical protein
MTVNDLRRALVGLPGTLLIGAEDQDGTLCEVQIAQVLSCSAGQYFLLRANGGFPLFEKIVAEE